MARVIRRRKNPLLPPLLILVFLFLTASVLATLFYNSGTEDAKARKRILTTRRKIISDTELSKDAGIKQIIDEYDEGRGKAPTVVAELNGRIAKLTRKITGSETTAAAAVEQIESTVGKTAFVLNAINAARRTITDEARKVKELKSSLEILAAEQQDAVTAYKKLEEEFQTKAAALAEEKRALAAANTTQATEHATELKSNDATWREKVARQEQEVDTLAVKVNKLSLKVMEQRNVIKIITEKLEKKLKIDSMRLAVRELGRIKEHTPNRDVCFIPLGSRDRVVRGMTFRAYGPEGIPSDGEGHKAALTVTRVFDSVSQCRVSTVRADDPIAIGDLFANVAFDPTHQPVFVVEGRFDLSGMGRLTETGTREVIALIKRSGGKVADRISVDVDFVVMSPEPSKPAKLPDGAPGTALKAWEIRTQGYKRWHETLNEAIKLNVAILNTRRFIALTGYETLREYED
ncbi:MAG: hypothetical protein QGH60_02085 [Phycisphaerae bacterium]|jgi:hypothetical protein|nr:hypothetical protein [Phycisphaerae bacterium]